MNNFLFISDHPSAAARSELSRESQLLTATTAFVLITAINGFLKSTIEAIIQAAKGSHLQAASEKVENATENKIILQHCQINANGGELNKEYAEQIELLFTSGAHKTR